MMLRSRHGLRGKSKVRSLLQVCYISIQEHASNHRAESNPPTAVTQPPAIGLPNANASSAYLAVAIELELSVDAEFSPILFASQTTRLLFLQTNLRPIDNSSTLLATTPPPVSFLPPAPPSPGKTSTVVVMVFQQPQKLEIPQKYLSFFEKLRQNAPGVGKNSTADSVAARTEFDIDAFARDANLVQVAGASLFTVVVVIPGSGGAPAATATVTRPGSGTALPAVGGGGNGGGAGVGKPPASATTPCGTVSSSGGFFSTSLSVPLPTSTGASAGTGLPVGSGGASAVLGGSDASSTSSLHLNSSTSATHTSTTTSSSSIITGPEAGSTEGLDPAFMKPVIVPGRLTTLTIWPINYATGGAVVGAAKPTGGAGGDAVPSASPSQQPIAAGAGRIDMSLGLMLSFVSILLVGVLL